MKFYFLYAFTLLFVLFAKGYGQSAIETDRPDATETVATVPKGMFQAEAGFSHEQEGQSSRTFAVPASLLKFGVSRSFELRLGLEWGYENEDGATANGLQPMVIGAKARLWKEKGLRPAISLLAQAALPKAASEDFELDHIAPEVRMLFQNRLSKSTQLGYNAGAEWDGVSGLPTYLYTVSPCYELTKRWKAFAESYGYFKPGHHVAQWVDAGFLLLLADNIQLDFAAGYELTHTGGYHNFFESVGFSFRI